MKNVESLALLAWLGIASQLGAQGSAKVWENYDFVPGSSVLFYTDFSEDRVGNFARALKYVNGPAEVIERDGVKMLRSTGRSAMLVNISRPLPKRFTLEIDILATTPLINGMLAFEGGRELDRGDKSAEVSWSPNGTFIIGGGQNAGMSTKPIAEDVQAAIVGGVTHIRVLMDEAYFKMYMNERRLYNIPELQFLRAPDIRLLVIGSEENPTFITGIRIAESNTDVLYDALASKGRWATLPDGRSGTAATTATVK